MAIYYVYSGAGGANNGSSWANAFTTLTAAFATEAAGDTLYVAHDHAESTASALTLTSSGTSTSITKIICVNRAGSVPPVSADRRTTATVTTTGANNITFQGIAHFDGIIFQAGSAGSSASIILNNITDNRWLTFDNCSLRIVGTGASGSIVIGQTTVSGMLAQWNNTTVSFAAVTHAIQCFGRLIWRNTSSALLGTIPTTLFTPGTARGGSVECSGVDFSAAGSGKTIAGASSATQFCRYEFYDCKLNASVTKSAVPVGLGSGDVDFVRCGSSGVNYNVFQHRVTGTLDEETTIVRTGGASDGTTPIAWKVVTTANCTFSFPFECPPIAIWNDTSGSSVTATVEGVWGGGAVPNDDEVWLDVEYLGDASSPQASFVNDGKANLLATAAAQTSSSETWGGSTTKFKLHTSFVAQQKGWIYCRVKVGKASSTFFIDPMTTLS